MSEKEFQLGVYMKPNGNLVTVEVDASIEGKFMVLDGKTEVDKLTLLLTGHKRQHYVGWSSWSLRIGWGPTKYLNKSEYLGEL